MFINLKTLFISTYNDKAPRHKKIFINDLMTNKNLRAVLDSIEIFIKKQNLDPKRLVDSIIDFFMKKNGRFPNIFLFKGERALSIYKDYELATSLDLSEMQKIVNFVKKSKNLQKNMALNGIIYSRGVIFLKETKKASPYYLLAHGITDDIPKECIEKWESSNELKKLVLDAIFS